MFLSGTGGSGGLVPPNGGSARPGGPGRPPGAGGGPGRPRGAGGSGSGRGNGGIGAGGPGDAGDDGRGGKRARRYAAHKDKKRGWRRWFTWKKISLYAFGMFVLGIAGIGIAYAMTSVPQANDFSTSQATIVYWNDGTTELGRFSAENRENVGIEEIPEHVQHAVIAAEDRSFYENSGFDPVGIARAGWNSLTGGEIAGGGSTITQQYVKNYYLTQEQTITRKIRELFISIKIDQQLDKDQILQDYLNTIWFSRGTYGVQTASKSYFGKSVSDLTLEEGAALAAILRSPTLYDPTLGEQNVARFTERFRYVLDGMVEKGWVDQATAEAALPPTVLPEQKSNQYANPNGYLLQQVRSELRKAGIDDEQIETGGLRVVTTFSPKAQTAAVNAVNQEFPPETENSEGVHVGLAAVKPGDGAVVAMYGGKDAVAREFNSAVDALPQAGSTIKPFTLLAALESGISLESRFRGNSPLEDEALGDQPVNNEFNQDYGEYVGLVEATAKSINTAFVDLTLKIGPQNVYDAAVRAGIPAEPEEDIQLLPNGRITLGTASVAPISMADAYATFAAQGKQADWYTVVKVTDPSGAVLYEGKTEVTQAFEADIVADATYAMTQVVEDPDGSGSRALADLGRPAAGKTGTAALYKDSTTSSWFTGFTPQLSAAVGFYREDAAGKPADMDGVGGLETFFGGRYPAQVWTAFMKAALEGEEVLEFPKRSEVGKPINPSPTPTPTPTICPPGTEGTPPTCTPIEPDDQNVDVPNVVGLDQQQAERVLERAGFNVSVGQRETDQAPPGQVVEQNPAGGTAPSGSTVTIVVATGTAVQNVNVPNVVGKKQGQAEAELQNAGFNVAVVEQPSQAQPGEVISQAPTGTAPEGSTITIYVSAGNGP